MDITYISSIAIVGAIASLFMEWVKVGIKSSLGKKFAIVAVSILMGGVYALTVGKPIYNAILGVLTAASTIYAFFLKK
jgi:hypothetical protein